jgi:hypothetical protein
MHPNLTDVFTKLDESQARLRAAVDAVPPPWRSTRPAPDRWSVAEILEHLALVETRLAGLLRRAVDTAMEAGLPPETGARVPLAAALVERMADRVNKRPAPETAIPSGTLDHQAAAAAAGTARAALRDALARADGLALNTVTIPHQVFGELNAYQWLELMAGHEHRHAAQIDELRQALAATLP